MGNFVNKIKILFLIDQIYSSTGGTEQHISFLMKMLPQHNCEIYFGVLRELGEIDAKAFPVKPFYVGLKSFRSVKQVVKCTQQLVDFIQNNDIKIVQTFFSDSELLGILAVRKIPTCTLVATRRNMGYWHTWKSIWLARLINQVIPHFLANCEAVKKQTAQNEWARNNKIHYIYNPLPSHRLNNKMSSVDIDLSQIKDSNLVVGIVGNVRPIKNYENFIRAAKIIYDRCPHIKFLIVGSTVLSDYKTYLDDLVLSLNLVDVIIFTDEVENPTPLIRRFDVGVLSSDSEGFSNALVEYGMLGVPTVATDVGGTKEVVIDKVTGFIVPPQSPTALAKSILILLESFDLRREFGANAEEMVAEKFSPILIVNSYLDFYGKLLKNEN